ncbi:OmpA family protein [Brachybacterium sp. GCM10030267]|uniref:OmpA family protein n=1 Tax=Brachybacterium sp. GCM10030267 TaxID=3273381 RepID=UPI00360C9CF1
MRRRALIGGLITAPVIAACDGQNSDGSDGGGASDGAASPSDAPPPSVPVTYGPLQLDVAVTSVIRTGDYLVVTIEITADDPDDVLDFGPVRAFESVASSDYVDARQLDGLRLLDLDGDRVAMIAMDAEDRSVHTEPEAAWKDRSGSAGTESLHLVYGDLGPDEVSVLIPKGGLLSGVPVTEGEIPEIDPKEPLDLSAVTVAPINPLISYTTDLTTTTRTESTQESTTVSLGADVLFDSSSADLGQDAQAVIDQAAQTLSEHEPGPVQVVGHTDDVDDEAFNQDLSERRAQAVADVLGTLIDGQDYPLEVSGQGESSPVASNDTQEGRALNRRVELSIDTPVETEETVSRDLPEIEGPVATGEEGVEFDDLTPVRFRAPSARLVQDHLVVRFEITRLDDEVGSSIGVSDAKGDVPMPEDVILMKTYGGIAVMNGPVATFPALHRVTGDDSVIRPLADLRTNSRIDGGTTRVDEIVYPGGTPVGETVTIEEVQGRWRLTDIPVTR